MLDTLLRILDTLLGLIIKQQTDKENKKYAKEVSQIRSNPRDFFDDGLLNDSDTKGPKTEPDVSNPKSPRQP